MPRLRILPLDVEFEAAAGATVMGAAQARGYYWPTTCNGEGRCTTCACEIVEGAGSVEPMGRQEQKTLVLERGEAVLSTPLRLACQARIRSDGHLVVVRKAGVRPPAS
jgi:2Fe-2S ferredoxin